MQQVEHNEIPFYGEVDGYNIMLLEFPHGHIIPGSDKLVAWLLQRNIRPLIAHPERTKQTLKDPTQLQPFIKAGCWLQVTAGSVTGNSGEQPQHIAHPALKDDFVTVLARDAHNAKARQPALRQAFDAIAVQYGTERARRLTLHTPARITASQFTEQAIAV